MKLTSMFPSRSKATPPCQSKEISLLLACAHVRVNEIQLQEIKTLVQGPLDWPGLLKKAEFHRLLTLLHWNLKHLGNNLVPQEILSLLHDNFNENFQRNMRLLAELLKLVQLFEQQSIPVLAFKGPVLAQSAYGNLALRQFLDLDILIPESYVVPARQLLLDYNYQPQPTLTTKQQIKYAKLRNELCFWNEDKEIAIDLHWALLPKHFSFSPDETMFWRSNFNISFAKRFIPTLIPEHLLLFLCAHGAKHNWSRLYWIADVAEVINTYKTLNWQLIQNLSGRFGKERMLFLGLYLAYDLLGALPPDEILRQVLSDPVIPGLGAEVKQKLFQSQPDNLKDMEGNGFAGIKNNNIQLKTIGSIRDRVWYLFDIVFTPTLNELQIISLPQKFFFLYYPIRILRLAFKYWSFAASSITSWHSIAVLIQNIIPFLKIGTTHKRL